MCIYIYIYMYIDMQTHTYINISLSLSVCIYVYIYIYTYIHTYISGRSWLPCRRSWTRQRRRGTPGRTQQPKTYPHPRIPATRLFFAVIVPCFSVFSSTWGNPHVGVGIRPISLLTLSLLTLLESNFQGKSTGNPYGPGNSTP